jgi:hypothetical protein
LDGGRVMRRLRLGERSLHAHDRCAFCDARCGEENLRPAVLVTLADALVCEDTVACERRRYRARVDRFAAIDQGRWAA